MDTGRTPKSDCSLKWTPRYPLKMAKMEKSKYFQEKNYSSDYPNQSKTSPCLFSMFNGKYNYLSFLGNINGPMLNYQKIPATVSTIFQKPLINPRLTFLQGSFLRKILVLACLQQKGVLESLTITMFYLYKMCILQQLQFIIFLVVLFIFVK